MAVEGLSFKVEGDVLHIVVPNLQGNFGPSKSGKTLMVASTGGFVQLEGSDCAFAVNVTRKAPKK